MALPLRVRGVVKAYDLGERKVEVLRGVDLDIRVGELCAVMGPSGVGKSTLLNCVAGLDVADAGQLEVFGTDVGTLDDEARTIMRRRQVGIIYQFFNLVGNLTAEENVTLPFLIDGVAPDMTAIQKALDRVGMLGRADHMPSQLSGGEMQLVSIARAIVRQPGLLLADEPTGNVNVATGVRIMNLLREVLEGSDTAMLMVTHNPEDAARADRVVFMKDGVLDADAALTGDDVNSACIHDRLRSLGI